MKKSGNIGLLRAELFARKYWFVGFFCGKKKGGNIGLLMSQICLLRAELFAQKYWFAPDFSDLLLKKKSANNSARSYGRQV